MDKCTALNIKSIPKNPDSGIDVFLRLRNSFLGNLYRSYLKKYSPIRVFVIQSWKIILFFHLRSKFFRTTKKKIKKSSYIFNNNKYYSFSIYKNEEIKFEKCEVKPKSLKEFKFEREETNIFPEKYLYEVKNATVYGKTNFIFSDKSVVCHDLYNFTTDTTSEELHGRVFITPGKNLIRTFFRDNSPEHIEEGSSFLDACSANYAHWLTEVLPRVSLFCSLERYTSVPIIIDCDLHPNILESLFLVVGKEREVFCLPEGRALKVDKLYQLSVTGYVPFGRRNFGGSHGLFSPYAFKFLRQCINRNVDNVVDQSIPKKIYLKRNSQIRRLVNEVELEKFLVREGFSIVEVEKLSFPEQFCLFKNVKEVVAPTGAALANSIFCSEGTKVIVLMAKHQDMIYRYWSNMLSPLNISVSYVIGEISRNYDLGIHGDFYIDCMDIKSLLN